MYSSLSAQPIPCVAALDLALDIAGMDRLADILGGDKAQYRDLAGLGIDLDIAELGREAGRLTAGIDRGGGGKRAAGQCRLAGDLLQRHRLKIADIAAGRLGEAVLPDDALDIDAPDHRGAAAQLLDKLLAGVDDRHAG